MQGFSKLNSQRQRKARAVPRRVRQLDSSAVQTRDFPGNGETQPRVGAVVARSVRAVEALENLLFLIVGDARPVVLDPYPRVFRARVPAKSIESA